MNAAQERDNLRLLQMRNLIDDYERRLISEGQFLQSLDTLLASLEGVDPSWVKTFKSEWWTMEQIYAASQDPELRLPDDRAAALVSNTLGSMKALLSSIGPNAP